VGDLDLALALAMSHRGRRRLLDARVSCQQQSGATANLLMKFAIKNKNKVWLVALNRTDLLAVSVYGYMLDIHRQKD